MTEIAPHSLDHVALWVADRDPLTALLCDHLGMHVIERTGDFTLVGADALRGKLTLFAAEGPRDAGPLERVVLRVSDLDAALARLPDGLAVERVSDDLAVFAGPEGLGLGLAQVTDTEVEYDLDHVVLRVPDPDRTRADLAQLGFQPDGDRPRVADKYLVLRPAGTGREPERPLLNHLALLVDSADVSRAEAERRGVEVTQFKDAANTLAVFVRGPDGVEVEYVEHKPGFALV
jgi:catechol 2,3-dioxygenase-like lactoylglutathione lyase family enzyme